MKKVVNPETGRNIVVGGSTHNKLVNLKKPIIFTYGRLNPPTKGHEAMIMNMIRRAKESGASVRIILSHSQNNKKNPLTINEKKKYLSYSFPNINMNVSSKERQIKNIIMELKAKHPHVQMVVGSDRVNSFKKFLNVNVQKSGMNRVEGGVSGTKARIAAMTNNKNGFRECVSTKISNENMTRMMLTIKKRLKNIQTRKK